MDPTQSASWTGRGFSVAVSRKVCYVLLVFCFVTPTAPKEATSAQVMHHSKAMNLDGFGFCSCTTLAESKPPLRS